MGALTTCRLDIMTVVAAIQAAWMDYPLVVESGKRDIVDQSVQQNPYLKTDIRLISAQQADMADHPLVEQRGQILLSVVSKDGTGDIAVNKLLDFVVPYFDMKDFSLVRCHAVEIQVDKLLRGWWYSPAIVNFYYHRVSN